MLAIWSLVPLPFLKPAWTSGSSQFTYCFILFILLCLGCLSIFWQFVEFSLLWSFLTVGGVVSVACQGFLVKEACVSVWWAELDFFSLECNEVYSNELWDVSGFGVTLGSLYIEGQGCVPVLPENLCGMSCSGTCRPLGGAWFQCRYGGFWMSSYRLIIPGVRSSLVFSGFGLKPPASGFQSYSYSSLKTSPSPFEDNGLPFWVPDILCQHSEVVL